MAKSYGSGSTTLGKSAQQKKEKSEEISSFEVLDVLF
jgi:hypothetical protein